MGWGVYLRDEDGTTVSVPKHTEGGTIVVGSKDEAYISITYNYSELFKQAGLGSLKEALQDKKAKDVVENILSAAATLGGRPVGTERDPDYWKPTAGNARHALTVLAKWCELHPEATFDVS